MTDFGRARPIAEAVRALLTQIGGATAWRLELHSSELAQRQVFSAAGEEMRLDGESPQSAGSMAPLPMEDGIHAERRPAALAGSGTDPLQEGETLVFTAEVDRHWRLSGEIFFADGARLPGGDKAERALIKALTELAFAHVKSCRSRREATALRDLLTSLAVAIVIVDPSGEIVLDVRPKGVGPDGGGERQSPIPLTRAMLARLVKETKSSLSSKNPTGKARPYFHKTIRAHGQVASMVYVVPLLAPDGSDQTEDLFAVLLPIKPGALRNEMLEDAFSLTPAEAKVVGRIIAGKQIKEVSEELDLSHHTVRTYLKRSFIKVGVNNQPQLISRVNMISLPLRE